MIHDDDDELVNKMLNLSLMNDVVDKNLKRKNEKFKLIDLSHMKERKINEGVQPNEQTYPIPDVINEIKNQILVSAEIENEKRICLLDTGADICVLGRQVINLWERIRNQPICKQINIRTAGGEIHPGQVKRLKVTYDNETRYIQFVFAPTIAIPIALGMNFCNAWNIRLMRTKNIKSSLPKINYDCTREELEVDAEENVSQIDEEEEEYSLTFAERTEIQKAMNLFNYSNGDTIGCQKVLQHKIDTGENAPIFSLPYRYNPSVIDKVKENIKRWLVLNIIEPSTSNWRLPIVVVTKKDKSLRLCLDARKLNAITKRDCHTPPNVLHKIDSLPHKAKYYIRLDLNEAFLQTELAPKDRKKTAFSIPGLVNLV